MVGERRHTTPRRAKAIQLPDKPHLRPATLSPTFSTGPQTLGSPWALNPDGPSLISAVVTPQIWPFTGQLALTWPWPWPKRWPRHTAALQLMSPECSPLPLHHLHLGPSALMSLFVSPSASLSPRLPPHLVCVATASCCSLTSLDAICCATFRRKPSPAARFRGRTWLRRHLFSTPPSAARNRLSLKPTRISKESMTERLFVKH